MSKSRTMLRTRRKDNNVKPNRRLDRKSSRGMLFENEDLRLKTININAEVERGQSDIKKLKRENDQLRREIWYLRDEYDKLDKLLREKECRESSSSSSSSSESESCSSCTEESEPVETSQNKENFQKTNLKKITEEFDLLSVVPEENSGESSEKNSNTNSNRISPEDTATNVELENHVIKPDQSYPDSVKTMPKHFFAPIKNSKSNDDYVNNQFLGPESPYREPHFVQHYCDDFDASNHNGFVPTSPSYPGFILPSLPKQNTDVIVKMDNQNFNTIASHSSFSNGGNLEELLNDIETISHDILKISNPPGAQGMDASLNYCPPFPCFLPPNDETQPDYFPAEDSAFEPLHKPQYINGVTTSRPYKSELNVVLMPTPMQLIGVEKYKNIQKSCESLNARSRESLSEVKRSNLVLTPASLYGSPTHTPLTTPKPPDIYQPIVPVPPFCPGAENKAFLESLQQQGTSSEQTNPFYFGNIRQNHAEGEYFNPNGIQEHLPGKSESTNKQVTPGKKDLEMYSSKANLLDTTASSDHVSSENEENLKFKTSRNEKDSKPELSRKDNNELMKSPKNLRHKVSIHFKGKKDKTKKEDTPTVEVKKPFFDLKFTSDSKEKKGRTSEPDSAEVKTPANELKTHSPIEVKKNTESSSTSDQRSLDRKPANYDAKISDSKHPDRNRKSSSASPERKHGHKESKKSHKKHKKSDKNKIRISSNSVDRFGRERSFSICTDRSNILDHRLGMHGQYDDLTTSDRERTNSLSSCDTVKARKMSNLQHIPSTGKIPWCGCWGNGCV